MKKLSILNWTLIVLCLASGTLFLISNLKPYSIVELIEPELSNGLFVGQNFSTAKDSVAIRLKTMLWRLL